MSTTDRRLVTVAVVALGVLLLVPALFAGFGMMGFGPMMGPMMGGMWGTGTAAGGTVPGWLPLFGIVMQFLFLAAVVGIGYLGYRILVGASESDRALAELRLAYARGDLTDEEYEQRRDTLQRDS